MKKVFFTIAACANMAFLPAQIISFTDQGYRVEGERLAQKGMSNLVYALDGVFPGVQVVRENINGQTIAKLTYHGTASGLIDLAVYIDGAEYVGSLDMINVNDIESVTLMREGQNMKYGHRSAEGVILIEMKKARAGKFSLTFQNQTGITTKALPYYEIMNDPAQMAELIWEESYNHLKENNRPGNIGLGASQVPLLNPSKKYYSVLVPYFATGFQLPYAVDGYLVNPDGKINPEARLLWHDKWRDAMVSAGFRQENHIAVSGGDKLFNARGSFGFVHEDGYLAATGTDRFNGQISLRSEPASWVKLGTDIQASMMDSKQREQDYYYVQHDSPFRPIYNRNADGGKMLKNDTYYYYPKSYPVQPYNPMSGDSAMLHTSRNEKMLAGQVFADFNYRGFFAGVKASGVWWKRGLDYVYNGSVRNIDLVIDRKLNRVSSLQYIGWHSNINKNYISVEFSHEDIYHDGFEKEDISECVIYIDNKLDKMNHGYNWQAALSYNYDNRFTFRANALLEKQPYYFLIYTRPNKKSIYYSAGFQWNIKNESFFKDVKKVDNLRLYLDWARLNPTDGDEKSSNKYHPESFSYISGGVFVRAFDRVNLSANIYTRKSEDLVTEEEFPALDMWNELFIMYAKKNNLSVNTTGIDLNLQVDLLKSKDWAWQAGLNLSHFRQIVKSQKRNDYADKNIVGEDLHHYYYGDLKPVVDKETGMVEFVKDEGVRKKPEPDLFGGISSNLRYKNFDLNIGFTYAIGGWAYDGVYESLLTGNNYLYHKDMKNRWSYLKADNSKSDMPKISDYQRRGNERLYGLTNASYLALDYVNVGYNFDKPLLKKLGMKGLRVSLIGDNLFLISARKGFDPRSMSDYGFRLTALYDLDELVRKGVAGSVPLLRTFSLGLTMTL